MALIEYRNNEEDRRKSLQNRQKPLCNGKATGWQCKYFWSMVLPIDSFNQTVVKHGERSRLCILIDTADGMRLQGPTEPEMPCYCNQYVPSTKRYDPELEEFNPLSPEEIAGIEREDEEVIKNIKLIKPPELSWFQRLNLHVRRILAALF